MLFGSQLLALPTPTITITITLPTLHRVEWQFKASCGTMSTRGAGRLLASTRRLDGLSLALTPCLIRLSSTSIEAGPASAGADAGAHTSHLPSPSSSYSSPSSNSSREYSRKSGHKLRPRRPLGRLSPSQPLVPLVGLSNANASTDPQPASTSSQDARNRVAERSKALSRLLTALDRGAPDEVFDAFLQIPFDQPPTLATSEREQVRPMRLSITAAEMRRILRVLMSDTPRLRDGMLRLVAVVEEIKRRRRLAIAALEQPFKMSMSTRSERFAEFSRWDAMINAYTINSLVAFTGRCLRTAGPSEVNDALGMIATMQAELRHGPLPHRKVQPDQDTFNTLLSIVCRTVHPWTRKSSVSPRHLHEDDAHAELRSVQPVFGPDNTLPSHIARLGVESDNGVYTTATAGKIFDAILDRMRHGAGLTPDAVTYNVMINMYARLEKWDEVASTVRTMCKAGMLDTPAVNTLLWNWVRRAPKTQIGPDPIDEVGQIYQAMRGNLLFLERQRHSQDIAEEGSESERGNGQEPRDPALRDSPKVPSRQPRDMHGLDGILSADQLPAHIIPDEVTYSLLIKLYTFRGDFSVALATFKDMVSTPQVELVRRKDGDGYEIQQGGQEASIQPSIAVYDSFFRAFAKHGVASDLVRYNEYNPIRSEWEAVVGAETEGSPWNIHTFTQIFEGFMRLQPVAEERSQEDRNGTGVGIGLKNRAPSSNQLFFVLTAIRRVSGDDARWSLAMWDQVVDKFSDSRWTGLRLNDRLRRVEEFLQEKLNE